MHLIGFTYKHLHTTKTHLLAPQTVDMASHILLVIASFLAIICALPTASDPSPLQDSCVADPTSSGCMFYDDCSKN